MDKELEEAMEFVRASNAANMKYPRRLAAEVTRLRAEVERKDAMLKDLLDSFTRKLSIGSTDNVLEARMDAATIAEYRAALTPSTKNPPAKEAM